MSADAREGRAAAHLPDLDTFRGFAAILMVLNHAGVQLLAPSAASAGPAAAWVFLGSFAPVLFFAATGFGMGLSSGGAARPLSSMLDKVLLLVVADLLSYWRGGQWWGLDFFGFIALSMVFVALIRMSPRPLLTAAFAAATVVVLRYGIGPVLKASLPTSGVLAWLFGVWPQDPISYPAAPWLFYPAVGFLLAGLFARRMHDISPRMALWCWALASGAALVAALGAWVMWRGAGSFHRWGSVGIGFFLLSLSLLIVATMACVVLTRRVPALARLVALGGVSSFVVVPVHYALIEVAKALGVSDLSPLPYALVAVGVTLLALALSQRIGAWLGEGAGRFQIEPRVVVGVVAAVLLLAITTIVLAGVEPRSAFITSVAAQLGLAVLLARSRRHGTLAAPAVSFPGAKP